MLTTSLLLLLGLNGRASAQSYERSVEVYFRLGEAKYDPDFKDNRANLKKFVEDVNAHSADSLCTRFSVDFYGGASPEGSDRTNERLARQRLDNAMTALEKAGFDFSRFRSGGLHSSKSTIENWDAFTGAISFDDHLPHKEEVLAIISDTTLSSTDKEKKLKSLKDGVWNYMTHNVLSTARVFIAVVRCRTDLQVASVEPIFPDIKLVLSPAAPKVMYPEVQSAPEIHPPAEDWIRRLTVKTNTLGLSMLMANAAAEIDLTRNISLNFPVYYSALNYFTSTIKFRTFAIQPELRWNFTRPEGLFAGAHFGLAYFNLAANGNWRIQTHNGNEPLVGGGLSIGYRLPLTKNRRWNVEFTLGAGAYRFNYDKFYNEPNGALAGSESRTYIGLDNAGVSFSYSFELGRGKNGK